MYHITLGGGGNLPSTSASWPSRFIFGPGPPEGCLWPKQVSTCICDTVRTDGTSMSQWIFSHVGECDHKSPPPPWPAWYPDLHAQMSPRHFCAGSAKTAPGSAPEL